MASAERNRFVRLLGAALALSLVAIAPAWAEEAESEADAKALTEQRKKALEQEKKAIKDELEALEAAEQEIDDEDRRGIDADAEAQAEEAEEAEASSEAPPPEPPIAEAQAVTPWAPPGPDESSDDWIQTTSGEWLKGDFERLRDREVFFDSDEFDDQKIDWVDIAYFRFTRPHAFRFEGRRIFYGPAEMRKGVIKIRTRDGVKEFPRREIVSITRGAGDSEWDRWSGLLAFGGTLRGGNTKQTDFTGRAEILRETALTRYSVDYNGSFSRVDGNTATNTHRVGTAFDVFLTRKFYVTVPFFEYFTDENQKITWRMTPGAGVGYELIFNEWIEAETTLGAGAQHTRFDTDSSDDVDAVLAYGIEADLDLPYGTEWDSQYGLQLVVTDFGKTNHHAESVLSFDIWGPLDLDFSFVWDRVESPESSPGGSKPKSDDYRGSVEIAIDW